MAGLQQLFPKESVTAYLLELKTIPEKSLQE
jgi:hypothetical protein